jgi:large subunit ribosomal protein L10
MKRTVKIDFIKDYGDKFSNAVVSILADYRGLNVEAMNGLRSDLRKLEGGEFRVVKNSLCRRILDGTEKEALNEHLYGPTSIYFGYDDPVAPAKALVDFAKKNDSFEIKAAYYDGRLLLPDEVKALSQMASKPELQAMLLGLLSAPPRNFVNLLANVPRGLLNVLHARKQQLEEGAEA